jgi:hypothetical protein
VQARYHAIVPCLSGQVVPFRRAAELNLSYSTVTRWLNRFRENGMRGLFPVNQISRQPYTPEKVIVSLVFYKTCVKHLGPRIGARDAEHSSYFAASRNG